MKAIYKEISELRSRLCCEALARILGVEDYPLTRQSGNGLSDLLDLYLCPVLPVFHVKWWYGFDTPMKS